ncbi:hypothetical protein PS627_03864 [Pseudomonas fluorescens]|nr:hypothetical protein PS627_03864 [Pseudomonas fluorescens]
MRSRRLQQLVIRALDKHRAQALMARHQAVERLFQGHDIQLAGQAYRAWQVVGTAMAIELPEKPHALLRMGQGMTVVDLDAGRNRKLGEVDAFGPQTVEKQPTLFHWQFNEAAGKRLGLLGIHLRSSVQLGIELRLGYPYGT